MGTLLLSWGLKSGKKKVPFPLPCKCKNIIYKLIASVSRFFKCITIFTLCVSKGVTPNGVKPRVSGIGEERLEGWFPE